MTSPAGIEGSLSVRLHVAGGGIRDARVQVHRPMAAARALAGRTPAEALKLVPLLYSVCGTAQGVAALEACEQAQGIPQPPAHRLARALLVMAETATSHGWHTLMDWPRLLDEAPDTQELAALRTATAGVAGALYPNRDALRPGGGALQPKETVLRLATARLDAHITQSIFGGVPCPERLEDLVRWVTNGDTAAARLMADTLILPAAGFGANDIPTLPAHPAAWFAQRLRADPDFARFPDHDGRPAITGPLARTWETPLVREVVDRHGNGLAAILTARLVEFAALPARMDAAIDALLTADGETVRPISPPGDGCGAAVVETARGTLAHWVRLEDGVVADYRVVAPTEWNFHPQGALALGLMRAAADPPRRLHGLATRLIAAIDPCVNWALDIEREG